MPARPATSAARPRPPALAWFAFAWSGAGSPHVLRGAEESRRERDAPVGEGVDEAGPQTGAAQRAPIPALLVHPGTEVESEHVEQRDHVALHALDLGDV